MKLSPGVTGLLAAKGLWRTLLMIMVWLPGPAMAQTTTSIRVSVNHDGVPVAGADVIVSGITYQTGVDGTVSVPVPPGRVELTVRMESFAPVNTSAAVAEGQTVVVDVPLQPQLAFEEEVTVSATRTDKRLDDQPLRVEVLGREEIEEKLLMTPGDIVMMLNEMGGLRVQATSPSLGAASVRIQGMQGRYTRVFSDGLPLFGEVGGLGLLQIPPMDLGQVEVIKGVASSLYGAGAMGGVVNLISRRPAADPARELLINRSARGGTDLVGWLSTRARQGWALTLLGGGHWQEGSDVDGDAWTDLPGYSRGVIRPRVFWDGGNGRTLFATVGFTGEDRDGGTVRGGVLPATGSPYREALTTRRIDAGAVGAFLVQQRFLITARGAVMQQRHDHQFGEVRERDRHDTAFGELTLRTPLGKRHTLVGGIAMERNAYRPIDLPHLRHTFIIPGVFVQDDVDLTSWLSVSASGRIDHHSEYGTFFSPRIAALVRRGRWSSRLSVGTGFFGPSPLTEETEAAGLSRLNTPMRLRAEEGRSTSFDVTRAEGAVSYTATLFASRIAHPVHVERSEGLIMTNLAEPSVNIGAELLGTIRLAPYSLTATYTYVRTRETSEGMRQEVPLTPRHSAGTVGMWEREDLGRVGVELYYTGTQRLDDNPSRSASAAYLIVGLLAERQLGRVRVFINGENLSGVRQTTWDPLVRPTRAADGRWTVDAWAPLEGRNVNGGIRLLF
jgi:outer membrane receptor for ferrienterochelin and colicins